MEPFDWKRISAVAERANQVIEQRVSERWLQFFVKAYNKEKAMNCTEMPKYKCHKEVRALKIKEVCYDRPPLEGEPRGNATITPVDEGYAPFMVDEKWAMKHRPQVGGYYVVYEDGYGSFSPAEAFEGGYTRV